MAHSLPEQARMEPPPDPQSAPIRKRPPKIAWVGLAVLLAVGAYVGFWSTVARQVEAGFVAWADDVRNEGVQVAYESLKTGGFPFHMELSIGRPSVQRPDASRPWSWRGEAVSLKARPWNLDRIAFDLSGGHVVTLGADAEARAYQAFAGILKGTLEVRRDAAGVAGDVAIDAAAVRLPATLDLPMGTDVAAAGLAARLIEPLPSERLPNALALWRDAGGTVEIDRFDLDYGELKLQGDGTLALDQAMQPVAAFSARVEGFFAAVESLRRRGVVDTAAAVTAKLVLGALAKTPEGGGPPYLDIPVSVQDRYLFASPVALVRMPPVKWI